MSFDENLERLDGILKRLESEPMPLDTALGVFEDGIGLVRESETLLREAQQRVSVLAGEERKGEGRDDDDDDEMVLEEDEDELELVEVEGEDKSEY